MNDQRRSLLIVVAVVLFAIALFLVLFVHGYSAKAVQALTLGGFATFALGHVT